MIKKIFLVCLLFTLTLVSTTTKFTTATVYAQTGCPAPNLILSSPQDLGNGRVKFTISDPGGNPINTNAKLGISGQSFSGLFDIDFATNSVEVQLPVTTGLALYQAVVVVIVCEASDKENIAMINGELTTGSSNSGAGCSGLTDCLVGFERTGGLSGSTFITDLVTKILPITLVLGGFLSVIIIVISGIQFITSSGNPDGAAAARGRLTFALVGFVLLTLAFALTKFIDIVFLRGSGVF